MKRNILHTTLAASLLFLAACQGGNVTSSPTPSGSGDPATPLVSATGEVVPSTWADLSLPVGGVVEEIAIQQGQPVHPGDIILRLTGREQLEAQVASAQQELVAAQQALTEVHDQADVVQAQRLSELAHAREDLRVARYNLSVQQFGNRASREVIAAQQGKVYLAKKALDEAKRRSGGTPDDHDSAQAAINLSNAQQAYDSAVRLLNWYTGKPTDIQQGMLEADLATAEANVAAAEKGLNDVVNGPDPDALAQAEARLASAQARVGAAKAAETDSELRAPFEGSITELHVRQGEWVSPGQVVASVADLSHFQIETTDLDEVDAAKVEEGARATITFDALPMVKLQGTVRRVAQRVSPGSGVNFTALVSLDQIPDGLRWGMTAYVDIEIE